MPSYLDTTDTNTRKISSLSEINIESARGFSVEAPHGFSTDGFIHNAFENRSDVICYGSVNAIWNRNTTFRKTHIWAWMFKEVQKNSFKWNFVFLLAVFFLVHVITTIKIRLPFNRNEAGQQIKRNDSKKRYFEISWHFEQFFQVDSKHWFQTGCTVYTVSFKKCEAIFIHDKKR